MGDGAFEEDVEPKKPATATDKLGEMVFGGALEFVREVEHLLAVHDGNIPDDVRASLKVRWRKMGPLDTILVQQKLGSKLNAALN